MSTDVGRIFHPKRENVFLIQNISSSFLRRVTWFKGRDKKKKKKTKINRHGTEDKQKI